MSAFSSLSSADGNINPFLLRPKSGALYSHVLVFCLVLAISSFACYFFIHVVAILSWFCLDLQGFFLREPVGGYRSMTINSPGKKGKNERMLSVCG